MSLLDILRNAPPWAWIVLAALLVLGGMQMLPRRLPLGAVLVLPVAMAALSLYGALSAERAAGLGAWALGVAAALLLNGVLLRTPTGVHYDAASRRYELPGSITPFLLMMAIFWTRFAVIATGEIDPQLAAHPAFVGVTAGIFGFLAGLFASRAIVILRAAAPLLSVRASTRARRRRRS